MNENYIKGSLQFLSEKCKKLLIQFIIVNLTSIFFSSLISYLTFVLLSEKSNIVYLFVTCKCISEFFDFIKSCWSIKKSGIVRVFFEKMIWEKYSHFSFTSKHLFSADDEIKPKLTKASNAIFNLLDWGVPTLFYFVSSVITCVWIFFSQGMTYYFLFIVGFIFFVYYMGISRLQKSFSLSADNEREIEEEIDNIQLFEIPRLQDGHLSPDTIVRGVEKKYWANCDTYIKWVRVSFSVDCLFLCMIIFLSIVIPFSQFPIYYILFQNVGSSLKYVSQYGNQYSRYSKEYKNLLDIINDPRICIKKDVSQYKIPEHGLDIEMCHIRRDNFLVESGSFTIKPGEKILVTGPSGGGKTTFIHGLLGDLEGVMLLENKMENYRSQIVVMDQKIRERLKLKKVSFRKIFDTNNDAMIEKFLKIFFPTKGELEQIFENITREEIVTKKESEYILLPIEPKNPFEVNIEEKISGGQKTRILAAMIAHEVYSKNAQVLILDEPEQGCGELIVPILKQLFSVLPQVCGKVCIFLVTHMHPLLVQELNEKWDIRMYIENGTVKF